MRVAPIVGKRVLGIVCVIVAVSMRDRMVTTVAMRVLMIMSMRMLVFVFVLMTVSMAVIMSVTMTVIMSVTMVVAVVMAMSMIVIMALLNTWRSMIAKFKQRSGKVADQQRSDDAVRWEKPIRGRNAQQCVRRPHGQQPAT